MTHVLYICGSIVLSCWLQGMNLDFLPLLLSGVVPSDRWKGSSLAGGGTVSDDHVISPSLHHWG